MGLNDFLKKIMGNKAQRDMREISPEVEKIKAAYENIKSLSNDELRARTETLKNKIQDSIAPDNARIAELKASIEDTELHLREKIYNEVDKIEKDITEKIEKVLIEILPEAFAIMKDTARRLNENAEVVVSATDFDRNLAAKYDFVRIEGDKAIFKTNGWPAETSSNGIWCTTMCNYSVA